MTTKRYDMEYDGNCYKCIVDCEKEILYTDRKQIVDLLNEQDETIQQQKEAIGHLSYDSEYLKNNFEDKCKENEELKQQLDYIQNSISEHIKHQKTELGQKVLKEIIEDYNEWLLGHKELNVE